MQFKTWLRWTVTAALISAYLFTPPTYVGGSLAWSQQAPAVTSEQRLKRDVTFLASDECEGRGPGTKGIDKAADYIVDQFKQAGLKPGGVKGTWFQPFTIGGTARLDGKNVVTLHGPGKQVIELKLGENFQVLGNSGSGTVSAPLVFAGYGTTANDINFDEYKDLDVAGKIVVLIRRVPRWKDAANPFDGENKEKHAALENKLNLAEKHKALAVLLINDASEENDKLVPFKFFKSATHRDIPAVNVSRATLAPAFASGMKKSLAEIEKAIDDKLTPQSGPLTGWSATVTCNVNRSGSDVKNIIGVLEGAGPLAKETVVVGAHYDHLGYGALGGSLEPKSTAIHHGADDNASGTTTVMELARRFAAIPNRQGRRIVFMTFSAEELGLLGSKHYCSKEPLFPLDQTVAMVNLDMVGRLAGDKDNKGGKLTVEGVGTGKGFEQLIDKLNESAGFKLEKVQGSIPYSDHDSFYRKKVPIFFFFSGYHKQYHKPSDTSDLINVPGMKRIADLAEKVIAHLAADAKRPEFVTVARSKIPGIPKADGPRLGIVPRYDDSTAGLGVDDILTGGVGEKAGLKAGDVIVSIAGRQVKNITTYSEAMAAQTIGQTIEIGVTRDGKMLTLKATLK